jgi:F0F1-type ATP synthase epsilon subunit
MLEKSFDLEIISPTKSQVFRVEWVEVESITGCFLVGHDHSPLISIFKRGNSLIYKKCDTDRVEEVFVVGGVFSVEKNKATAILDF